ncbi:phage tail protein [Pantoea ananatis]|uniref:phage tail protein n=1 Tax=Pantoea ananas TaxID=553 RepID=UPI002157DF25|nr:phage tail protein [Pantoea ananatis]
MTTKYFALLTNQGAAKLANAAALGTQLQITQMAVGDGGGVLPTPDPAQTKLVGEKRRAGLNSLKVDAANSSQIIAEQIIPEGEGGFWIREIGLYDADGVLIAVANCAETYKPQLQEGSGRTQTVRMILIVNSTSAVTLKIDPSVVLATRQYVDDKVIEVKAYTDDVMKKHVDAANPHSQYLQTAKALAEIKDAGLVAEVLKNLGFVEAVQNEISRSRGVKQFISSGKFQVPDGVTTIYLSGCAGGGGGGGGGCRTNTSEFGGGAGGGGAGQSVIKRAITVKSGEIVDVIIGAGGVGGTTSVNSDGKAGGTGGNTVFGSYLTLIAGQGGDPGGGGSAQYGGAGGGGYPRGSSGGDGAGDSGKTLLVIGTGNSGAGASCPFGGGGGAVRSSGNGSAGGQNGYIGDGFGSGGAGGSTGINGNGAVGQPGILIVEW